MRDFWLAVTLLSLATACADPPKKSRDEASGGNANAAGRGGSSGAGARGGTSNSGAGGTAGASGGSSGSAGTSGGTGAGGNAGTSGAGSGGVAGTGGSTGEGGDAGAAEGGDAGAVSGGAGGNDAEGGVGGTPEAGAGGTAGDTGEAGAGGIDAEGGAAGAASERHWVGTWATGPQLTETSNNPPAPGLANNTLRQVVRVSIGGSRLRLRFSNQYGSGPVTLNAVHLARSTGTSSIDTSSGKTLTFSGNGSVTIPTGQIAWSDAFDFALSPLTTVAVTIHFGAVPTNITGHPGSRTTSYINSGNTLTAANFNGSVTTDHWYYVTGIDVRATMDTRAIVVLGDSITDGRGSTTNGNNRWPDRLAERLQAGESTRNVAVLNLGIGGNTVLSGGLGPTARARFDSDVLGQSGVRYLIVLEGVNDIGYASSAAVGTNLIAAYQEFIDKSHANDILAYGVPILPFGGSGYYTADHESIRQTVNQWVRTSGEFDAAIDLDAAVRDPGNTVNLLAAYDTGDHLHLNPAGYQAMANAVDLSLFLE
jgi:lysophospholipase L1-like esterase